MQLLASRTRKNIYLLSKATRFVIICYSSRRKLIPETRTALVVTTDVADLCRESQAQALRSGGPHIEQRPVPLGEEVAVSWLTGLPFLSKSNVMSPISPTHSSPSPSLHQPRLPPKRYWPLSCGFPGIYMTVSLSLVNQYSPCLHLCLRGPRPRTGTPTVHLQV